MITIFLMTDVRTLQAGNCMVIHPWLLEKYFQLMALQWFMGGAAGGWSTFTLLSLCREDDECELMDR